MPLLKHSPGTEAVDFDGRQVYRPVCGCGWRSKSKAYMLPKDQQAAQRAAEQHAGMKGCGKVRFPNQHQAMDALLQAKIANGIDGNTRRQEQRAYVCPDCPGAVWHLTRTPEFKESRTA